MFVMATYLVQLLICALFVMAPNGLSSLLHYVGELEPVKKKSCFMGSKQILRVERGNGSSLGCVRFLGFGGLESFQPEFLL